MKVIILIRVLLDFDSFQVKRRENFVCQVSVFKSLRLFSSHYACVSTHVFWGFHSDMESGVFT